jgi:hypothetical protein
MYPLVGQCPICQDDLIVTRLHCLNCDTSIEGRFELGRLLQLTPEQLGFIETFIRCEGKITRVEDELGISYPTVRSRLHDVIRALGYEVGEEETPLDDENRREILEGLDQGRLTSEEAIRLLRGSDQK